MLELPIVRLKYCSDITNYKQRMKYNSKTKMLEFSSDESVFKFHDQLTELLRSAMSMVGSEGMSRNEAEKLTREFFERYSAMSDTLRCLRAHLPRGETG